MGEATSIYDSLLLGSRSYELNNHLGNVLSAISDKKIGNDSSGTVNYYIAEVLSQNDYYPFGMQMPGRKFVAENGYRYGFNGKENDNEVKGEGNQQDYGMRIYDSRLGRFLSVDHIASSYPMLTPYQFASNRPIDGIDLDGMEYLSANSSIYRMQSYTTTGIKVNRYKLTTYTYEDIKVIVVYENIPHALRNPVTRDLKYTRGGLVTPWGRDYDPETDGTMVYPTGRYYNTGPEFFGDTEDLSPPSNTGSTQGAYSFNPDAPNDKSTEANKAAMDRVGSGPKAIQHGAGIVGNLLNQSVWNGSTKEQIHRQAFYNATNWANALIDANKLINFPNLGSDKGKTDLINFFVDGTLPIGGAKIGDLTLEQLTYNLDVFKVGIHFLDYMKTTGERVEVGKSISNTLNELISAYQKAGGKSSYEDVKKKIK